MSRQWNGRLNTRHRSANIKSLRHLVERLQAHIGKDEAYSFLRNVLHVERDDFAWRNLTSEDVKVGLERIGIKLAEMHCPYVDFEQEHAVIPITQHVER